MQLTKNKAKKKRNISKSEAIVHGIIIVLLLLFTLLCLLPFINILASSFATSGELSTRPFILIPKTFTLDAYRYILSTPTIFKAIAFHCL